MTGETKEEKPGRTGSDDLLRPQPGPTWVGYGEHCPDSSDSDWAKSNWEGARGKLSP
ncbi:hypothetical protein SLEP1_g21865 [Rubroshorea leprosula]|uniref:Uncharacterized protein n=1 Tax=Rubroshorea leprosula TaxID=152421 RepID=A0AAV5JI65_9ROSI|nr:hypothetical protein SLEP1_g21865 [Rubroshorea leprosula]